MPESWNADILLWHTKIVDGVALDCPKHQLGGKLLDISAGGLQVICDIERGSHLKPGQTLTLQFNPMPNEAPLAFNVQVRNAFPTADERAFCLGLQIVGLEASKEGQLILQRICTVVERYYKMNRCNSQMQTDEPDHLN